jgi:superfamily I DNA/RNA helicase
VVTLEQNYRSTQHILQASNAVIGLATERFTKNLWSEKTFGTRPMLVSVRDGNEQASYVVEKILDNREVGIELKKQAVLFRASHHSAELELELTRLPWSTFLFRRVPLMSGIFLWISSGSFGEQLRAGLLIWKVSDVGMNRI